MDYVRIEIEERVATVTFDRPPVNALDAQAFREIGQAFRTLAEGTDAHVAIFTAPGTRVFCAGVDLPDSARRQSRQLIDDDTIIDALDPGVVPRECFFAVADCALPVIGAINGAAVGAGLALVASCDVIIASENARFALPEINAGVLGGGRHLQRMIGPYKTRKMFFTGEFVHASEFYRLGAVEAVVPPDELMPTARPSPTSSRPRARWGFGWRRSRSTVSRTSRSRTATAPSRTTRGASPASTTPPRRASPTWRSGPPNWTWT